MLRERAMKTSIGENVESMKVNFIALFQTDKVGQNFAESNNYPRISFTLILKRDNFQQQ